MPPRKRTEPKPKPEEKDEFRGPEADLVILDEVAEWDAAEKTEADPEPESEPNPVSEPEPEETTDRTLEPLEIGDLVFDDGKVRALRSLFPLTIDDRKEQRLYIVEVPGEDGTLAAVWYTNTQDGPMLAIPVSRLVHFDDSSFTTMDGRTFAYSRSSGCGCGNKLKHWRPWEGWVRVVQMARR